MNIHKKKSTANMCYSKPKSALSTKSAYVRKSSSVYNNQQAYWNRRCQTAVYKPQQRMMEECKYHLVRQLELEGHKSALNNAVFVFGIHRSKSDVDVHSVQSDISHTSSLPREHSHTFLSTNASEILRERRAAGLNREETKIPTTTIPKKGLIKLTSLNHEVQDPSYYDRKDDENDDTWVRKKPLGYISDPHKHLVKKTMVDHMREGNKMLAEEEKQHHDKEEIEKQLGEFTIGDLHKNIIDMTETSKKKSEERIKTITKPTMMLNKKKPRPPPVERNITLPSIKDFTFG